MENWPEQWRTLDHGIRSGRYTDPEFTRLEHKNLWSRVWQMAARLDEVPEPGDYTVYDIGHQSVIVVRVDRDTVKAFYNACPHRGTALAENAGSFENCRIICPFHGWRWGVDGAVQYVLERQQFRGGKLADSDVALREIRLEIFAGFIFINFDRNPKPFDEFIAPVRQLIEDLAIGDMHPIWWKSVTAPANWKVAVEAFLEGYHVPATHPQLETTSAEFIYGDDVTRALPMIRGGHVDVVCFEALAEVTLAILQKDRLRDPNRGYTFDIGIIASEILPEAYQRKIPLITNGGGLNPLGAAKLVKETAEKLGLRGLKIAAISGDNFSDRLEELLDSGENLAHLETDQPLDLNHYPLTNANVYLGAKPIVEALQAGADIIITGRVADPCLFLAPLIAHYRWSWEDWDRLASGIVAGHLLECTAQVVGGNSLGVIHDIDAQDLHNLGYPIAHVEEDGSFVLTKTPDMAGLVTLQTVKEQLLYEIHDPANYITPDVIVDFTTLKLEELGNNQVRISDVTGKPRPEKLKLNLGQLEGYMRELIFIVGWPEAWKKVEQLKTIVKTTWEGLAIDRIEYSYPGHNSLYGSVSSLPDDPLEIIIRVMFTAKDEGTLKTAVQKMMNKGLSGPAGMSISATTISGKPRIILGLWPTLVSRTYVETDIQYLVVNT